MTISDDDLIRAIDMVKFDTDETEIQAKKVRVADLPPDYVPLVKLEV